MSTRSHPCVVVGVDRSLHGLAALRFAAAEAACRGVPLYAVRVQSELFAPADHREIEAAFAEALGGFPHGVEVHMELAVPPVAAALLRRASSERDLVVVGESGRGMWHTFWSGSVARACLRKAGCPVVAVPAPEMTRTVWRRIALWRRGSTDVWQQFEEEQPSLRG
jgi:nucleotide-binding universal stress UspA family protein